MSADISPTMCLLVVVAMGHGLRYLLRRFAEMRRREASGSKTYILTNN